MGISRFLMLIFLSLNLSLALAQNTVEDFTKINAVFENLKQFSFELEYRVYIDSVSNKEVSLSSAYNAKKDSLYYFRVDSAETIIGKDFVLSVNHKRKFITYAIKTGREIQNLSPMKLDFMIKNDAKVEFKKENDLFNSYTFLFSGGDYSKAYYRFNAKSFVLDKIVIYKKQQASSSKMERVNAARLEIIIKKFQNNVIIPSSLFLYDKFIEKRADSFVLKPQYSDYMLIDTRYPH